MALTLFVKTRLIKCAIGLGYVGFALVISAILLYLNFPSEPVRRYLETLAGEVAPTLTCRLGRIEPELPFALKARAVSLHRTGTSEIPLFKGRALVLWPDISALARGRAGLGFACRAYGGRITGTAVAATLSAKGPYETAVRIEEVVLERYPVLHEILERKISGTLDGKIFLRIAENAGALAGAGTGDISIKNGRVEFEEPFLDLDGLDLNRVTAGLRLEGRRLLVDRFELEGLQMAAHGSGTVVLDPVIQESAIDMTVFIKPVDGFSAKRDGGRGAPAFWMPEIDHGQFTLHVLGPIAHPRIGF